MLVAPAVSDERTRRWRRGTIWRRGEMGPGKAGLGLLCGQKVGIDRGPSLGLEMLAFRGRSLPAKAVGNKASLISWNNSIHLLEDLQIGGGVT